MTKGEKGQIYFGQHYCFPFFVENSIAANSFVVNYNKSEYHAANQNWAIATDRQGFVYIANNEGLLTFDGAHWRLHPLPNRLNIRSVAIDSKQQIFTGAYEEFGYWLKSLYSLRKTKGTYFYDYTQRS